MQMLHPTHTLTEAEISRQCRHWLVKLLQTAKYFENLTKFNPKRVAHETRQLQQHRTGRRGWFWRRRAV